MLAYISPISPLYLRYISLVSPLYLPQVRAFLLSVLDLFEEKGRRPNGEVTLTLTLTRTLTYT